VRIWLNKIELDHYWMETSSFIYEILQPNPICNLHPHSIDYSHNISKMGPKYNSLILLVGLNIWDIVDLVLSDCTERLVYDVTDLVGQFM